MMTMRYAAGASSEAEHVIALRCIQRFLSLPSKKAPLGSSGAVYPGAWRLRLDRRIFFRSLPLRHQ